MIIIKDTEKKQIHNFWSNFHFHPTDAIEDAWGKRILDTIASDKCIDTVRMYAMLEDIVTIDENGKLSYDFRLNDLRLDYMLEKGFNILLSYNFMPDCIAKYRHTKTSMNKNKTRYKSKLINTSIPSDYALWEEICYNYTKHIVERYGEDVVGKWYLQCFNEPDIPAYFLSDVPDNAEGVKTRLEEYCKLYKGFENGIRKASNKLYIGGPALSHYHLFLEGLLAFVKENNLRLDFISVHNYAATSPQMMRDENKKLSVANMVNVHKKYLETIEKCGFKDTDIIVDEWGAASGGFHNMDDAPQLVYRETEVFSAYYAKMIYEFIEQNLTVKKMLICLSGQHEMTEDFTGFRNFFTLNHIRKPIYNAFVLASRLHDTLLESEHSTENLRVIPTADKNGNYSVMLTYSSEYFEDNLPDVCETVKLPADAEGKSVQIYCIDKTHTNPYALYSEKGKPDLTDADIKELRNEGKLKPISDFICGGECEADIHLSANSVILITVNQA